MREHTRRPCHSLITARVTLMMMSLLAPGISSADRPDLIANVKRSIVAVGTFVPSRNPAFQFYGTGFVVGDGTLVATNEHVIPKLLDSQSHEALVVAVPDGTQVQIRSAKREASNSAADVILLKIGGTPLPALALDATGNLREGEDLLFTGFPLGNALGLVPVTHTAMLSAITPISLPVARSNQLDARAVHQLSEGAMQILQLDATAYPGNSGSPLYRPGSGQVVGIVNMVFVKSTKESALSAPSGISYAIPVSYLLTLVEGLHQPSR